MGLLSPSLYHLVPGYGPYKLVKAVTDLITGYNQPSPLLSQQTSQLLAISNIGWTQKTANHKVYDVNIERYNTIRQEVENALRITRIHARERHFNQTRRIDPLIVYHDEHAGYLTIDNRRLAIYRLSLPPESKVLVRVVTRDRAARIVYDRLTQGKVEAGHWELARNEAIVRQYSNEDFGFSINITHDMMAVIPHDVPDVQSPFMNLNIPKHQGDERGPIYECFFSTKQTFNLPSALQKNGVILFHSDKVNRWHLPISDNTSINLLSDAGDFLLHVSFRQFNNEIVLNSRSSSGRWGVEERYPNPAIFSSSSPTIAVCDRGDYFQILLDYRSLQYYKKRIQKETVAIAHHTNDGQRRSYFSEHMKMKVYDHFRRFESENWSQIVLDYELRRGEKCHFPSMLGTNGAIIIHTEFDTTQLPSLDNTSINLLSASGDFLLHISFRHSDNAVVFNSCYSLESWGIMEHVPFRGVFVGTNTRIVVCDRGDYFQILVDTRTLYYYKKRIHSKATAALYLINGGQKFSLFQEVVRLTFCDDYDQIAVENGLMSN